MLVENALKHNVVSQDEPLVVRIFKKDDRLVVENNLQKKNILQEESSGIGLENIKARYGMLSSGEVSISEENHLFSVSLPIIKIYTTSGIIVRCRWLSTLAFQGKMISMVINIPASETYNILVT